MKKQQFLLVAVALLGVIGLYYFGKTVPPKAPSNPTVNTQDTGHQILNFETLLSKAKGKISSAQSQSLAQLEKAAAKSPSKEEKIHIFHQLARFWSDTAKLFEPYAYYTAEAAKLENSEKNLTFAARLFLENLMTEGDPTMQYWLGMNAKVLFEKALELNPANDSTTIGLGACYLFGNISDNPMKGILPVKAIADKQPDNAYAQLILGLGAKRSGQIDKAIERLLLVVKKEPANIEALFYLAESFETKGDKPNAIQWYQKIKTLVDIPEAQMELDKRIKELKK